MLSIDFKSFRMYLYCHFHQKYQQDIGASIPVPSETITFDPLLISKILGGNNKTFFLHRSVDLCGLVLAQTIWRAPGSQTMWPEFGQGKSYGGG
jgi:hypothetical protein